jgi:hypothetical protein
MKNLLETSGQSTGHHWLVLLPLKELSKGCIFDVFRQSPVDIKLLSVAVRHRLNRGG